MDPGEQPQVRSDLGLRAAAVDSATGGVQTSTLSIIVEVNMMVSGGEVTVSGLDVRVRVSKSLEPGKVEMIVVPLCVGVVAAGRVDVSTIVEVSPGKVTVRVTGMLEPGKVEMYVVPACVKVVATAGTVDVSTIVETTPGKVTVDACKVCVWIDVVPGKVVTLPGAVVTTVVPGNVVTEPGSVLVIVVPGAVETLVAVTLTEVKLPEMLVVDIKVCVTVVSLPGRVLVIVDPSTETVEAGSVKI